MVNIAVNGSGGRMGQQIIGVISETEGTLLSAALERSGSPLLGQPVSLFPDLNHSDNAEQAVLKSDILIDFSAPSATMTLLDLCVDAGKGIVIGTTGLNNDERERISLASKSIPVLFAPNMSVGVNLLCKLVEVAAKTLGEDFDVEIIEAHHKHKKDAPSGTAIRLAEVAVEALGRSYADDVCCERKGLIGERPPKEIGVQTIRGGDIVGEHTVMYIGDGERIELVHKATNRVIFAKGAVRAACWLHGRDAGLYDMFDVLDLK